MHTTKLEDYLNSKSKKATFSNEDEIFEAGLQSFDPIKNPCDFANWVLGNLTTFVRYSNNTENRKRAIPTSLDEGHLATILVKLFTFKNVAFTDDSSNRVLMVYIPEEGIYTNDLQPIHNLITKLRFNKVSRHLFDNVETAISALSDTCKPCTDSNLIPVNNGIYDRKDKILKEFSSDYVFMSKCPVNYNVNATNPIIEMPDGVKWDVESWIEELAADAEINELIWQVIAASIRPNHSWDKAIWFCSDIGCNGKGTLLELIRGIVGKKNICSLSVKDFSTQFLAGSIFGRSCVLADENDVNSYIDSVANYKSAVTGDPIKLNRKYKDPIDYVFNGLVIQCMNGLPKTRDKTSSFYRRLILIPFEKSFTGVERPYIKKEYVKRPDVLEYVLYKILHLDFDSFIIPTRCQSLLQEYKLKNNSVDQFWEEFVGSFVWDLLPDSFLYDLFNSWNKRFNPSSKPMGKSDFIQELIPIAEAEGFSHGRHYSKGKMNKPEYLIIEYNLIGWKKQAYGGTVRDKIVDFDKKQQYFGFKRI